MADAWAREERDEDPLAKLERLVNARTDRMTREMRDRAATPAAGLRGAIEELYGEPPRPSAGAVGPAAPLQRSTDMPVDLSDLPPVSALPSLDALRTGWRDELPPLPEPADAEPLPRILRDAALPPVDALPHVPTARETKGEPDIELPESLDAGLSEAVASALAAAGAAIAATQTQSRDDAPPEAIAPLAVPDSPAYEPAAAPRVEPIEFGDDFERELVDELLQIEPAAALAPEVDPLIGAAEANSLDSAGGASARRASNDNGGRRRGAVVAAMLAGVAVLGGVGAAALNGGPAAPTEVALIRADTTPVKLRPDDPGGRLVPNQTNAVYERVAKVESVQAKAQPAPAIVDATEDVSAIRSTATRAMPTTPQEVVARATTVDVAPRDAVAPRPVRTIRVRPDGTLATMPPVGVQSDVPSVVPEPGPDPIATAALSADPVQTETAGGEPAIGIPVPRFRPVQIASAAPIRMVEEDAAPATATIAEAAAPQSVPPGGYVVQIASVPDGDAARRTYEDLSVRYAGVLAGRGVDYQVAEIAGKGTFHRVRIPAANKDDANSLCSRLKASGGACFVTR